MRDYHLVYNYPTVHASASRMYQSAPQRLDLIKMCEDCRVIVVAKDSFDPHDAPPRPRPRTTDDYLRERERNGNS